MMSDETPAPRGPWVQLAAFCSYALKEQDGVLSVVRIVDRFTVKVSASAGEIVPIQTKIALGFKPDDYRGTGQLVFQMATPSGAVEVAGEMTVEFAGGPSGVHIIGDFAYGAREEGQHWLEVLVNGDVKTRMPFHVTILRETAEEGEEADGQSE
jgi:hypothetical protein